VPAAGELVMTDKMLLTIGGCAANAAVDLVKMEVEAAVVGRVGSDVFGRVVIDMLRDHGVNTSAIQTTPNVDTSQTLIVNVTGQDRRFIHTFGANAVFSAADIPLDRVKQCRVLYLGGYLVMPRMVQDELIATFAAAQQNGAKTVLDVVVPGPGEYLSRLDRLLPHVDVFLPNDHEAGLMTDESDPIQQAEIFRQLGAKTVVITMGGEGSVLVSDKVRLRAGVFSVPFVDGSGGGDAFDAGFIYGMLNDMSPEDCLRVASALGASCVRAIGTTPGVFTRSECEDFLRKNSLRIERI
jgi:sugar/nucleoside kinase (ribokinase family)